MRFSAAVLVAAIPAVFASPVSFLGPPGFNPDPSLSVPGENPFYFCSVTHETENVLNITRVDLSPLPPKAGQQLTISAAGQVKQTITDGAYVIVAVRLGFIKILTMRFELCEEVEKVNLKCPVEPGDVVITTQVDLPQEIPPGEYIISADAKTVDDKPITCLNGKVKFNFGNHLDL